MNTIDNEYTYVLVLDNPSRLYSWINSLYTAPTFSIGDPMSRTFLECFLQGWVANQGSHAFKQVHHPMTVRMQKWQVWLFECLRIKLYLNGQRLIIWLLGKRNYQHCKLFTTPFKFIVLIISRITPFCGEQNCDIFSSNLWEKSFKVFFTTQ